MNVPRRFFVFLTLACVLAAFAPRYAVAAQDETFDSAVFILRRGMSVSRDGRHNLLLRALRQMRDPQLEPLFSQLAQSDNPSLKIHGLLGLAEAQPERKLDLVRVAAIENPLVQAEVIGAAMDSEMLSDEQARQLLNWPGLDIGVKVVVAAPLVKKNALPDAGILREAAKAQDNLGRVAMCHLMLLQLGEPGAMEQLQALNKSADPKRDTVREVVLQSALRYEFERIAPWAMALATEPGVSTRLGMTAMRAALQFKSPGAANVWLQRYKSDEDMAERTRLAILALQLSPWIDPAVYPTLLASDDSFIRKIGAAGQAVSQKKNIAPAVVELVQMNHPIINNWAIAYAKTYATDEDAQIILLALILAADGGPERNYAQRLDDAVSATHLLCDKKNLPAAKLLHPILANPKTSPDLVQAILVGLMRSDMAAPQQILEGLPPFAEQTTQYVAVLLLAKNGQKLTPEQLDNLSLAVRGGGSLLPTLRVQAAWTYLKITNKTGEALAEILGG